MIRFTPADTKDIAPLIPREARRTKARPIKVATPITAPIVCFDRLLPCRKVTGYITCA